MSPGSRAKELLPRTVVVGDCQICGPSRLLILPFRYDFRQRHLYGAECETCGLVFLHPMLSDEEITSLYGEEYFTECSDTVGAHGPGAYMEMAEDSEAGRRAAAARLDDGLLRRLQRRGTFLEIGCGPGFLLSEISGLGWDVRGLEISEYAATHAREKLGLDVTRGSIEPAHFPEASFDAVFLGDVLEHLPRPMESLGIVRTWMKTGGIILIAIPSTLNLLSAKLGMTLYAARGRFKTLRIPPYHLFEYKPRTVRALLEAARFRVVDVDQSAVPLRRMGLRGTPLENAGKVALQIVAHFTSKFLNSWGDRLFITASK